MSGRSIRLIDRDELLATLEQDINVSVTGEENMEAVKRCLQEILDDVKDSPVVDAVPVIRCRDCYWYRIVELKNDGTENRRYKPSWCFFWNAGMNEVDFCSLAERKDDDTDKR